MHASVLGLEATVVRLVETLRRAQYAEVPVTLPPNLQPGQYAFKLTVDSSDPELPSTLSQLIVRLRPGDTLDSLGRV